MSTESKPVPKFTEKVIKEGLTHAGKVCAVGDEIQVTASQRKFLRGKDFIADGAAKAPAARTQEA